MNVISNRKRSRKGFTLLELIVAVVVISLLALLAVVSFDGVRERSNDSADQTSTTAFLRSAQAAATLGGKLVADGQDVDNVLTEYTAVDSPWTVSSTGTSANYREIAVAVTPSSLTIGSLGRSGKCVVGRVVSGGTVTTWVTDAGQCVSTTLGSATPPTPLAPVTTPPTTTLPRPQAVYWFAGLQRIAPNGTNPAFADGPVATASFAEPWGLNRAADGTVLVADHFNHRVRAISPGGVVSTVIGDGVAGWRTAGGTYNSAAAVPVADARLNRPRAVAVAASGVMYIADRQNNVIRRYDPGTGMVTTAVGSGVVGGCCGAPPVNANPLLTPLRNPTGVALDPTGVWLWVTSTNNGAVYRVNLVTNTLTLVTQITPAISEQPTQIEFDTAGNAYLSSAYGVHRIDGTTLAVTSLQNTLRTSTSSANCASGPFCFAYGMAVSPDGSTIWVANRDRHQILQIAVNSSNFASSTVAPLIGAAQTPGYVNGIFATAEIFQPLDVLYVAADNYLLVSDAANSTIRRIDL